jgi:hypothetical protein
MIKWFWVQNIIKGTASTKNEKKLLKAAPL